MCQYTADFSILFSDAGAARVKDCLEEHRNDDDFPSDCRDELEAMMQERSTDFRLDSILREACKEDIMLTCGWDDVRQTSRNAAIILC